MCLFLSSVVLLEMNSAAGNSHLLPPLPDNARELALSEVTTDSARRTVGAESAGPASVRLPQVGTLSQPTMAELT